jgi:hypothetical protein
MPSKHNKVKNQDRKKERNEQKKENNQQRMEHDLEVSPSSTQSRQMLKQTDLDMRMSPLTS